MLPPLSMDGWLLADPRMDARLLVLSDAHTIAQPWPEGRRIVEDNPTARIGWEVHVSLVCTLCARVVGRARGPNTVPTTLTSIRVTDVSHAESVRRLRCPHCLGRLWLQDREVVYANRDALTTEDRYPRRGRPRKVSQAS